MAEYGNVMKEFRRMCWHYRREFKCDGYPLGGTNISQCRRFAFDEPQEFEATVMQWVSEHPEPVYPSWSEWLKGLGLIEHFGDRYGWGVSARIDEPIPADIAQKLGLQPLPKA